MFTQCLCLIFPRLSAIINCIAKYAGVMELADVPDSKSGGSDTVRVRPPSPAPKQARPSGLAFLCLTGGRTRTEKASCSVKALFQRDSGRKPDLTLIFTHFLMFTSFCRPDRATGETPSRTCSVMHILSASQFIIFLSISLYCNTSIYHIHIYSLIFIPHSTVSSSSPIRSTVPFYIVHVDILSFGVI